MSYKNGNCNYLLALLILLSSCGTQSKQLVTEGKDNAWLQELKIYIDSIGEVAGEEEPEPFAFVEEQQSKEPAAVDPDVPRVLASLQKTPCFGRCPVFEVRVYSDGKAVYNGQRFTDRKGIYEASVSKEALSALLEEVAALNPDALSEEYPRNGRKIPDLPSTIVYINTGTVEKKIANNHDAPQALLDFERYFLDWIELLNWVAIPRD